MIAVYALTFALPAPTQERRDEVGNWDFDVYLDDKKVGKHIFTISEAGGVKHVQSQASFKVKILFISAYRYEHIAAERWTDNCLVEIDASTNANGKRIQVSGEHTGAGLESRVSGAAAPAESADR
jgi:hypothetical protein